MRERKERKSKGSLSVLEEFTSDSGAGEIVYSPKANSDILKKIDEATRLADIPISSRTSKQTSFDAYNGDDFSPLGHITRKIKSTENSADGNFEIRQSALHDSTVSQPLVNRELTVSQPSSKPLVNRELTVNNSTGKSVKKEPTVSPPLVKPLVNRELTVSQPSSKPLAESDVLGLAGKHRKLLFFIFQKCESIGCLETQIVTTEELKSYLDVSAEHLRNIIFKLQNEKSLLKVTIFHPGRSGWRRFLLEKEVFQIIRIHLSSSKPLVNRELTVSQPSSKPLAYPLAEPPYSSSNSLNNNTNTGQGDQLQLCSVPENLSKFGISAINLQSLIASGKTTQEVVERSLAALSFDVENGKSGNFTNILFGVLGKGKEYISQKYSESLQKELDDELTRISAAEEVEKKLQESMLKRKFMEYLEQNPDFLDSVKLRNNKFINNAELIEKMAFEEFRNTIAHATK